jgi:LDH2 family malate/lactate/ureidoglycolate dehydrogenase
MICLNIEAFLPLSEFNSRLEKLVAEIKSVPLAKGFEEVFYPGEMEIRNEEHHRQEGLELPEQTLTSLVMLAQEAGLKSRLPF